MDLRRALARRVLEEGLPVAAAAREFGVSRPTAAEWVRRARQEGLAGMSERSRRPLSSPSRTEAAVEERLAGLRREHPYWGCASSWRRAGREAPR